ncbi:hypothetical protein LCGC14_2157970, partial [marine sediment metagenome]
MGVAVGDVLLAMRVEGQPYPVELKASLVQSARGYGRYYGAGGASGPARRIWKNRANFLTKVLDAIGAGKLESGFAQSDIAYWAHTGTGTYLKKGRIEKLRVIASLGARWTTRVVALPGARHVRRGPYRFLRHPNYLVVALEIPLLPLA